MNGSQFMKPLEVSETIRRAQHHVSPNLYRTIYNKEKLIDHISKIYAFPYIEIDTDNLMKYFNEATEEIALYMEAPKGKNILRKIIPDITLRSKLVYSYHQFELPLLIFDAQLTKQEIINEIDRQIDLVKKDVKDINVILEEFNRDIRSTIQKQVEKYEFKEWEARNP